MKSNTSPDIFFHIEKEKIPNNGEDSWAYDIKGNTSFIGVFDGSGGIGSQQYEYYSGKTGAYVASRAVSGATLAWFEDTYSNQQQTPLEQYVATALSVCEGYSNAPKSKMKGSLRKNFPTTMAALVLTNEKDGVIADCLWAGDSRCYVCDSHGMHQLSNDDSATTDAMESLTDDGPMKNVINTSVPYVINKKRWGFKTPILFLTATDGCFGYLPSPMHFEYMVLDSLIKANNIIEWQELMFKILDTRAGDDFALCVAGYGVDSFDELKAVYSDRHKALTELLLSKEDLKIIWRQYRNEYERYISPNN